ncbi:MAG: hypothetical protein OXE87_07305 [Chloroflexi bacterium]|nr:hypothetical protein [Chloroflexota bacterium]
MVDEQPGRRGRLIGPEEREGHHHWVHRGTEPRASRDWSVRAGEYAHNLRSALDRMVWQMAAVRGQCAGRRGGGSECPGRHNRFAMEKPTAGRRLAKVIDQHTVT